MSVDPILKDFLGKVTPYHITSALRHELHLYTIRGERGQNPLPALFLLLTLLRELVARATINKYMSVSGDYGHGYRSLPMSTVPPCRVQSKSKAGGGSAPHPPSGICTVINRALRHRLVITKDRHRGLIICNVAITIKLAGLTFSCSTDYLEPEVMQA